MIHVDVQNNEFWFIIWTIFNGIPLQLNSFFVIEVFFIIISTIRCRRYNPLGRDVLMLRMTRFVQIHLGRVQWNWFDPGRYHDHIE